VEEQVSHSYQTTRKTSVWCISIFTFWERRQEDKNSEPNGTKYSPDVIWKQFLRELNFYLLYKFISTQVNLHDLSTQIKRKQESFKITSSRLTKICIKCNLFHWSCLNTS
jgi:hypothetical protein